VLAAAIGQEIPLDLWAAVAGVPVESLLDTVERCAACNLLSGTSEGAHVRFTHALLRDACYDGALPARRRGWHQQIGEALALLPHHDRKGVAYHLKHAGDVRAVEWLIRAGDLAYRGADHAAALSRYEEAALWLNADSTAVGECAWLHYRLARANQYLDPA